jgi:hypothetical protein
MKARKANAGGKWVAVQRGLLKRGLWWPFRRELFWPLPPCRYGTKASAGQTFHALLPEKP